MHSAKGRKVFEFGARRSQGYDGAVYGARASYIGGVDGTATTLATPMFWDTVCWNNGSFMGPNGI